MASVVLMLSPAILGLTAMDSGLMDRLGSYGYGIGGISTGVGLHPTGVVYESRSAQGLGKRSADAEPGYLRSYGYGLGLRSYGYGIGGISRGVGLHPTGLVYESRSAQGLSG